MVPIASGVDAAPPELRTPAPVIYLADNLDEKDRLGYCIDTLGRGLSDRLQAHSCKPAGGDVQFVHVEASGHIRSATYTNKCAQLLSAPAEGVGVALLDCSDNPLQRFEYDRADQTIRPGGQAGLCLAAGAASRSAGPFMSRDLLLADCAQAEPALIRWEVVGGP
ncbi:ricin-type beta-trefoil lectin domain protein [Hoeflea sp.]|uniref:ricin-type beta-trefoil lectin domain protein n=1 Tax=Hoeflea sp. TaxID=1940281 RepID=UPI003B010E9A